MLDKSLRTALLISMGLHILLFAPLWHLRSTPIKKFIPAIEVSYLISQPPKLKPPPVPATITQVVQQPKQTPPKKDSTEQKELLVKKSPVPPKPATEIEIPPELPKEKEALYLSYYQSIREKIRTLVLRNYPRFIARGEVCLFFVLDAEGSLKELKVVEDRSSVNRLLKQISRESVQQAAPFLPFPKDLDQPQLSFNVIISFELEK